MSENQTETTLASQLTAAKTAVVELTIQETQFIEFSGPDAANYLHRMTSNHVEALQAGEGQHSLYMNAKARLISELWLFRKSPEALLVEAPKSVAAKVSTRLKRYRLNSEFEMTPHFEDWQSLHMTGPRSRELLTLLGLKSPEKTYAHEECQFNNTKITVIQRPDFYSDRFSILVHGTKDELQAAMNSEMAGLGGLSLSEESTEFMRIDCGIPAFGKDLTEGVLPQEAYLEEDALHFEKGCYPGQETVAKIKYRGKVNRFLVKLQMSVDDFGSLPTDRPMILRNDKIRTGILTSFSTADSDNVIGLGYVKRAQVQKGRVLQLEDAGTATVTPLRDVIN